MKYAFIALLVLIILAVIGICYALSKPKKGEKIEYINPFKNQTITLSGTASAPANVLVVGPRIFPPRDVSFDEEQYAYCLRYGARLSNAHPNPESRNKNIDFNNPVHIYIHPLGKQVKFAWYRYRDKKGKYIKKELADRIGKTIYDGLGITTKLYQVNYLVIDGVFYITHHLKQPMLKCL